MLHTIDLGKGPLTFFNGTSHNVNLIPNAEHRGCPRKYYGGHEIASIPMSRMLSAKVVMTPVIDLGSGVWVVKQEALGCQKLPDAAYRADYIIVSALYAKAFRAVYPEHAALRLVCPTNPVFDSNGIPHGCTGFEAL